MHFFNSTLPVANLMVNCLEVCSKILLQSLLTTDFDERTTRWFFPTRVKNMLVHGWSSSPQFGVDFFQKNGTFCNHHPRPLILVSLKTASFRSFGHLQAKQILPSKCSTRHLPFPTVHLCLKASLWEGPRSKHRLLKGFPGGC